MLLDLPTELLLSILKHLPVAGIIACRATNSVFRSFVDQHESTIYRQAASHPSLYLIPHDQILLQDVRSLGWHSARFLGRLGSWKDLCRRACEVRSSWRGRGPSRIRKYDKNSPDVHRIKVDEKRGFFIVTYQQGGLAVVEILGDERMWRLPTNYVRPYAHCEYGEGFLIFDRFDGSKEVWRLVSDDPQTDPSSDFDVVPESLPDAAQQFRSNNLMSARNTAGFVAHALLRPPDDIETRAYRFVYPTLLTAAHETLLLWDVRTGKLVERINNIQRPLEYDTRSAPSAGEAGGVVMDNYGAEISQTHLSIWDPEDQSITDAMIDYTEQNEGVAPPHNTQEEDSDWLGNICYVDINDEYAFVCGSNSLRVFRRRRREQPSNNTYGGGNADDRDARSCVLELTSSDVENDGKWFFRVGYVKQCDLPDDFRNWRERRKDKARYWANATCRSDTWEEKNNGSMSVEGNLTSPGQHQSEEGLLPLLGNAAPGSSGAVNEDSHPIDIDGEDESNNGRRTQEGSSDPWWWTNKAIVSHDTDLSRAYGAIYTSSEFQAAHVSPCGQHLATLLDNSRLLIIPYFERLITGEVADVLDIKIDIQLNALADSIYLAYEDGRIGVVTGLAVFIIHPTFPDPSDLCTAPQIEVQRVISLNDPVGLRGVTCLQMTQTALWLNWEIGATEREYMHYYGRDREARNILREASKRVEVVHEEKFEMSMDTGLFDPESESETEVENSFVLSVDLGV